MEEVGQWPIRRDTYAKLMDRIFVDGEARQIGIRHSLQGA